MKIELANHCRKNEENHQATSAQTPKSSVSSLVGAAPPTLTALKAPLEQQLEEVLELEDDAGTKGCFCCGASIC